MKNLLTLLLLAFISCNNTKVDEAKLDSKEIADKLNSEEDRKKNEAIVKEISGEGKNIPKGIAMRLQGIPNTHITQIQIIDKGFTKEISVKNPDNKLKDSETYITIDVQYDFSIQQIGEYNSNDKIVSIFHTVDWYIVDTNGRYSKVLTNLENIKTENSTELEGKHYSRFFDGNVYSRADISPSVPDKKTIIEQLCFKLPENSTPWKLIYLKKGLVGDSYISMNFEL